jgi:hypothetical protein
MATDTAVAEKPAATESTAKDGSVLTADPTTTATTTSTTPPLAAGVTPALPQPWMSGLTSEQKANAELIKSLSSFEKGIPDLVEFYAKAEVAKGKAIVVPSEGASKEELAAFRKAVGVPEKPDDYKLEEVKLPNGETLDPEWDKNLKALAHKINISQGQLNELHKWYFADLAEAMKFVKTSAQAAHAALRKEMGADYDAAMTCKARAVKRYLSEAAATRFEKTGLGNDPEIIKMFAAIGKEMGDHVFAEGTRGEKPEAGTFGTRTNDQLAKVLYPDKK